MLVSGSLLAIAADAVTTQRFTGHGVREGDPLARPLVKYGWSGQMAAVSLEVVAEGAGMVALHRIGQHWVERMLPACLAATHGVFAYNNTKLSSRKDSR